MDYYLIKKNNFKNFNNCDNTNDYNNCCDDNNYYDSIQQHNSYKDFIPHKNIKNKNFANISLLENKILELRNKLEFYKKYEDKLCNDNMEFINNSVGLVDKLISELDKNLINKAQFVRGSKQIEFEF